MSQDTTAMDDLVGLDNLVANTAYLRAQHIDAKELRKQRLLLPRPKSSGLKDSEENSYESLCEQQPIGKKLFHQFLQASNPQYAAAADFLQELSCWSLAEEETRRKANPNIPTKFCRPESKSFLFYLVGEAVVRRKGLSGKNFDKAAMDQMREATRDFLRGEPFSEYLKSPFFYRFLQWKEFEKQKITAKYFYEFRTLGKGGFGEVGEPKHYNETFMIN